VEARVGAAILSFRRGLYPEAEIQLKRICERNPSHGPAHFYRGEALNRLGRVDEALETMERTIQLQPRNWRAYHTLGMLFDRKEDRERASEMYRQARKLNPL
jgi:Flp pilus assembly protein TadD